MGEFAEIGSVPGEPVYFVPYSRWSKDPIQTTHNEVEEDEEIDLDKVPAPVRQKIIAKLSEMSDIPARNIHPTMSLAADLGIDSLDAAELAIFLEEQLDIKDVPGDELTTVKRVFGVASRQIELEGSNEMKFNFAKWKIPEFSKTVHLSKGKTIEEVFLKTALRMKNVVSCADEKLGVLTYRQLLLRMVLLAEKIKALPGKHVGILLPSSVAAMILVFSIRLAGKIPVMINWTIGPRHVNSVIEAIGLKVCLSSWSFLDRLSNVDLGHLVEILVQLEDMAEKISFKDQISAVIRSRRSFKYLHNYYELDKKSNEDTAVILFTSGSEGNPKGVPLTHKNILSNINSVLPVITLYENDVFISILPPFHSFGFTVCGMVPLLLGMKSVFYPNPTEGAKIAKGIEKWKGSILCGAPSFLKNIFKSAHDKEQLQSLRFVLTGAEKAPEELSELAEKLGLGDAFYEGYGITECSPILTANWPGEERKGVGRPIPGVEIDIINPDTFEKVGINTQGLILASGPNVFSGYLNQAINPFVKREEKNWYITGDLGYIDEKGRLTITGRIKRFVKVGPEMISLGAIEEAITEQRDKLGEIAIDQGPIVAACAKEIPGEKPRFYLFTTFPLSVEKANVLLKQVGFSNLVRIHHVHPLLKMPLMGSGKINYQLLENEYLSHIHIKEKS
jgi:long-chain-fatty-acid--[acyl-carrier-protein] ligase